MNDLSRETPESPELEKKPIRIIYIEDQKDFRELTEVELKKFPANVELIASFGSTEEASKYLMGLQDEEKDLPDVIVSDENLGDGKATGVQFATDLKKQGFEIPVVLFTGYAQEFKSLSKEYLDGIGVKSVVDKSESAKGLVVVLKSIKPESFSR